MNIVKKAGCILINMKEKKIALVLRNGNYSFPKGHLEEMETIKDCAKRETIEETGHEVEILGEEISIIRYKSSGGEDVENHFFIGIDTGRTNKKIAEKDKEKTEWFEIDKVKERLAYQNLKDTWNGIKPKIEKIVNELQLDILISKQDKYYYSYIKLKDESYIPTNIYYIEDLNLDAIEQYNFNNHIIYFLCNLSLNNKVISALKNKNCYFINKNFFLHNYTILEVQQVLNKNNIDIPEIVTINGLNKIQYPIFCKENSHVGINLIAYSENTLVKFFCKFNISDFYCEKIITGGKEMKLYCINNIVYDNNKVIKDKQLMELFRKITNSLQIETYSADIINKENKNIVIDINPNSGFFGSNIARKNFLKYVIDCSKDIINNYGL